MKEQKSDREIEFKNITALVKEGVRDEVRDAMASLVDKQNSLEIKQNSLDDKQTNIESDNITLKSRVSIIESELAALKNKPAPPSSASQPWPTLPPPQASYERVPPLPSVLAPVRQHPPQNLQPTTVQEGSPDLASAVGAARKVIGFSPITREDLDYLKDKLSITDDIKAMKYSIFEFLEFEMKAPKSITDGMDIATVFFSSDQSNCLFAEFLDADTSDIIFSYVLNLRPGTNIDIYVPPTLRPRNKAVGRIAFDYRNGTVKHKTKIRYGPSDFILSIKEKGRNGPWSTVPLNTDCLPPLDLYPSSGRSSPAPGRCRLPSKRNRSASDTQPDDRATKTRKEDPTKETVNDNSEKQHEVTDHIITEATDKISDTVTNVSDTNVSPPPVTNPAQVARDLGSFLPSACVSPRAALNKNFTFGSNMSSIPKPSFKSSLN